MYLIVFQIKFEYKYKKFINSRFYKKINNDSTKWSIKKIKKIARIMILRYWIKILMVVRGRIELPTRRFSVCCSTD